MNHILTYQNNPDILWNKPILLYKYDQLPKVGDTIIIEGIEVVVKSARWKETGKHNLRSRVDGSGVEALKELLCYWSIPKSDEDLVKAIVESQVVAIQLQRKYKDNPLWLPPLVEKAKLMESLMWEEALRRGLNIGIHEEVKKRI